MRKIFKWAASLQILTVVVSLLNYLHIYPVDKKSIKNESLQQLPVSVEESEPMFITDSTWAAYIKPDNYSVYHQIDEV